MLPSVREPSGSCGCCTGSRASNLPTAASSIRKLIQQSKLTFAAGASLAYYMTVNPCTPLLPACGSPPSMYQCPYSSGSSCARERISVSRTSRPSKDRHS
jgi:hypothetical protein